MTVRRTWGSSLAIALVLLAGAAVLPACQRRKPAEVNPIVPSIKVNRTKAPLGSALEITYTWTVEPGAKKLDQNYWALVHFLDNQEVMLFSDDHQPEPPPSTWEPGKTYTYTRTRFVPVYPYVGEVEVRMGLYPYPGRGERPALKGEDKGFREYKVATLELLPQTENIFVIYKDGWHQSEVVADGPSRTEWQWTKKEATLAFRNPKRDVVLFLDVDNPSASGNAAQQLDVLIADQQLGTVPIQKGAPAVVRKIPIAAAQLGTADMVELRLIADKTFVPALEAGGSSGDSRELGVRVFHAFVQ